MENKESNVNDNMINYVINDDLIMLFKMYNSAKCEMTRLVQYSFAHFLGIQDVKALKQKLYASTL